jgi:hypothetical protein
VPGYEPNVVGVTANEVFDPPNENVESGLAVAMGDPDAHHPIWLSTPTALLTSNPSSPKKTVLPCEIVVTAAIAGRTRRKITRITVREIIVVLFIIITHSVFPV